MFTSEYQIKFSDCDPAGVLFFANAFVLCHNALENMLTVNNIAEEYFSCREFLFPVYTAQSHFLKKMKLHQVVYINLVCNELRESSFSISYRITDSEQNELARIETVHICVDANKTNKAHLPDYLTAVLRKYQS